MFKFKKITKDNYFFLQILSKKKSIYLNFKLLLPIKTTYKLLNINS